MKTLLLVATIACTIFLSCQKDTPQPPDGTKDTTSLYLWANDKVQINPEIFGINNSWNWIANADFPSFIAALDKINYKLLRFPGGWESEHYNWNNNTTPGWSKPPARIGASPATLVNNVSTFSIVIPTLAAMDKPLWSAAWWDAVASLQKTAVTAINKVGANKVKIVEIGNEWWLHWGGGVPRRDKLRKYAKIAMNIAEHINQQFPNRTFKLLVNGDFTHPEEFTAMRKEFAPNMKAYNAIDGVALHPYVGYDSAAYAINKLSYRIKQCINNFNPAKKYVYLSEWAASRAYNSDKRYMQNANIIPDIIHIFARAGVKAAAYWPPINGNAAGIGLLNSDYNTLWPNAQILGELARNYTGHAVSTKSGSVHLAAARNDDNTLTLYVTGSDRPSTKVSIKVYGFTIASIKEVIKFRPANYKQTRLDAPYVKEMASAELDAVHNRVLLNINVPGQYEIFKVVLKQQQQHPLSLYGAYEGH